MNRRSFLQSAAAVVAGAALPVPAVAIAAPVVPAVAATFSASDPLNQRIATVETSDAADDMPPDMARRIGEHMRMVREMIALGVLKGPA